MRILDSNEYINEKLDIKPFTKNRMSNLHLPPAANIKDWLESGDILLGESGIKSVYVTYKDIKKYKYDDMLELELPDTSDAKKYDKGCFISTKAFNDGYLASYLGLLDNTLSNYIDKAVCVYRNDNLNQPLDISFFDNPPLENCHILWENQNVNPAKANESLGIKPVTRELLKSYSNMVKPKNLLKTGHIIKCREVTAKHLVSERTYIYLEYKDIQKYYGTIGFFVNKDEVDKAEEGVFVRVQGSYASGGTAFLYVSVMDDNLVYKDFTVTEILEDENQPLHMYYNYFKDVTEHNILPQTITIWKSKNR